MVIQAFVEFWEVQVSDFDVLWGVGGLEIFHFFCLKTI